MGHGGGVPARGGKAAEQGSFARLRIEMERLRIISPREAEDFLLSNGIGAEFLKLTGLYIFKKDQAHSSFQWRSAKLPGPRLSASLQRGSAFPEPWSAADGNPGSSAIGRVSASRLCRLPFTDSLGTGRTAYTSRWGKEDRRKAGN